MLLRALMNVQLLNGVEWSAAASLK
jgi:hypothetical protein